MNDPVRREALCRIGFLCGNDLCARVRSAIGLLPYGATPMSRTINSGFRKEGVTHGGYVRDNNVDQALRALKKKLQREGVYREMKMRRFYEKPSEKKAREQAAAVRRARKLERKRLERDGLVVKGR